MLRKSLLLLVLVPMLALAHVDTMWVRQYYDSLHSGTTWLNRATDIQADSHGNAYLCGVATTGGPGWAVSSLFLAKYNQWGDTAWTRAFSGSGHGYWGDDIAHAITLEGDSFVYFVGAYDIAVGGDTNEFAMAWEKFDSSGAEKWRKHMDRPGDDIGFDIARGKFGDLYICGTCWTDSFNGLSKFLVARINPSDGDTIWTRSYILDTAAAYHKKHAQDRHPDFYDDYVDYDNCATALAIDSSNGDIVVTGFGLDPNYEREVWTMKFNPSGTRIWEKTFHNLSTFYHDDDVGFDVIVANDSNIYVAGFDYLETDLLEEAWNFAVIRYDQNGTRLDVVSLDGDEADDFATTVCLDNASPQNVYVTGCMDLLSGMRMVTHKFSHDLRRRWGNHGGVWGRALGYDDYGYDIFYKNGRVYVTGNDDKDLTVVCYSDASQIPPDTIWTFNYSADTLPDLGTAIWVNDSDHVYVGGQSNRIPVGVNAWSSIFTGRFFYPERDVGIDTILYPVGIISESTVVYPRIQITNYGNAFTACSVHVVIDSTPGYPVYDIIETVAVPFGSTVIDTFTNGWTATPVDTYDITANTILADDINPTNDTANGNFIVLAKPSVTVTVPNGGEVWPVNSAQTITCTHSGGTAITDSIFYSTDGGATWIFQFKEAAANTHTWNVPDTPTEHARIRIVAFNVAGTAHDESDSDFIILGRPSVTLTVPNGGEVWPVNSVQTITCTHGSGPADADSVFYSTNGGATWIFQFEDTAANSHTWNVPDTPTEHARIRIVAINAAGTAHDESDSDFHILGLPSVTLTVPNGGEVWPVNSVQTITCTHGSGPLDASSILLNDGPADTDSVLYSTDGGATWIFQFKDTAANSHTWNVPDTPTEHARIRIVAINAAGTAHDESDSDFHILGLPSVTVTVPNGGEVWPVNSVQTITCTHSGGTAITDSILYSTDGGATWIFQFKDTAANSHIWNVPDTPTEHARIRIVAINAAGTAHDESDSDFHILGLPSVTVTVPNGGEVWPVNSAQTITCTHGSGPLDAGSILLNDGPADTDSILCSTDGGATWIFQFKEAAADSHPWNVPNTPTEHARIRIVAINAAGTAHDESDDDFTIGPAGHPDIGVTAIVAPTGRVDTSEAVRPQANVWNYGIINTGFTAWFMMSDTTTDVEFYRRSVTVAGLQPGRGSTLEFPEWPGSTIEGPYATLCSLAVVDDTNPANDTMSGSFVVSSTPLWPEGWKEVEQMPLLLSNKPVKRGGWLAYNETNGMIYAGKGYKTCDFYFYNMKLDRWGQLESIPLQEEGRNKPPRKGCKGVSDGQNYIYMTKGNNTLGFWRYDIAGDTWERMTGVPEGPRRKKVKGGTDLVYVVKNDTSWVYLLKGYKTEFYKYDVKNNTWTPLQNVPWGTREKYDKGSFLVYDGENTLYAHQAKYYDRSSAFPYHYMFKYDLRGDSWYAHDTLRGMPLYGLHSGRIKKKKSKDGGSGIWYDHYIYALKGGNTQQFFKCDVSQDSWYELDTVPTNGSTGRKKRVKYGADIVFAKNAFWALKGNKTLEFWRYGIRPGSVLSEPEFLSRYGVAGKVTVRPGWNFEVRPNPLSSGGVVGYSVPYPVAVSARLYDAMGRLVRTVATDREVSGTGFIRLKTENLAAGVYVLRLDAGTVLTRNFKLVIR